MLGLHHYVLEIIIWSLRTLNFKSLCKILGVALFSGVQGLRTFPHVSFLLRCLKSMIYVNCLRNIAELEQGIRCKTDRGDYCA